MDIYDSVVILNILWILIYFFMNAINIGYYVLVVIEKYRKFRD